MSCHGDSKRRQSTISVVSTIALWACTPAETLQPRRRCRKGGRVRQRLDLRVELRPTGQLVLEQGKILAEHDRILRSHYCAACVVGMEPRQVAFAPMRAGAEGARELDRIAPVVFALHAGPFGDPRRRNDVARGAPLREHAVQDVALAARFVRRVHPALASETGQEASDLAEFVRQAFHSRAGAAAPPGRTAAVIESLCTSRPR